MKIVLAPFGSRGDVEPMLAVGTALVARGHHVLLCAPPEFEARAAASAVPFASAGAAFRGIFDGSQSDENVFLASLGHAAAQYKALLPVCENADVIVGAALQFAAPTVAQVLSVPYRYAVYSPMYLRSTLLPPFGGGGAPLEPDMSRALWAREDAEGVKHAGWLQEKRNEKGLAPLTSLHLHLLGPEPVLGAFDPEVCPLPADALPAVVTGQWHQQSQVALSKEVAEFVRAGEAPLYLGFGSMTHSDSAAVVQLILSELLPMGVRVLVGKGWSDFNATGIAPHANCMVLNDVAHDALFPHMAGVIHHGGAGTTMAAVRAGVPQMIIPHLGDQFYHGSRLHELGVAPAPVAFGALSRDALSGPLRELISSEQLRTRAFALALIVRARDGSNRAVEILEACYST